MKSKPTAKKTLKELCPALYESPEESRKRCERIVALLKSPLFTEDLEGNNEELYKDVMKSIAKSRGHKVG